MFSLHHWPDRSHLNVPYIKFPAFQFMFICHAFEVKFVMILIKWIGYQPLLNNGIVSLQSWCYPLLISFWSSKVGLPALPVISWFWGAWGDTHIILVVHKLHDLQYTINTRYSNMFSETQTSDPSPVSNNYCWIYQTDFFPIDHINLCIVWNLPVCIPEMKSLIRRRWLIFWKCYWLTSNTFYYSQYI